MMPDRENVIKDNAIRGLQSAIEISGALVHLRKEHAKAILELLKEHDAVEPFHRCIGKDLSLIEDSHFDYCPYCGKPITWAKQEGR